MNYKIRVKPGSSREGVEAAESGELIVRVRAKPVDGQANEAVIRVLAEYWDVAKSKVVIRSGHSSKHKLVELKP